MRVLKPVATPGLKRRFWTAWTNADADSAFDFALASEGAADPRPFVCFFLVADPSRSSPKISFDQGDGFNELAAISFLAFPFAFYHVPLATMGTVRGIRFRPCREPTHFRFVAFRSGQPLLVAILHFLFNLRYQKIGLVAAAPRGRRGTWAATVANVRRIAKFFSDVSAGSGIRVQQAEDDVLARAKLAQTLQVMPVQDAMKIALTRSGRPTAADIRVADLRHQPGVPARPACVLRDGGCLLRRTDPGRRRVDPCGDPRRTRACPGLSRCPGHPQRDERRHRGRDQHRDRGGPWRLGGLHRP